MLIRIAASRESTEPSAFPPSSTRSLTACSFLTSPFLASRVLLWILASASASLVAILLQSRNSAVLGDGNSGTSPCHLWPSSTTQKLTIYFAAPSMCPAGSRSRRLYSRSPPELAGTLRCGEHVSLLSTSRPKSCQGILREKIKPKKSLLGTFYRSSDTLALV